MALSSITHLEKHIVDLENKEKLMHKDLVVIKGFIKRVESRDADFKEYHCNIIDLVEDEVVLIEEQAKLEDHEDKVFDIMSRLLELGVEEEKVPMSSVAASSKPLEKRLALSPQNCYQSR